MEILEIRNFLSIRSAKLEARRFTVIIGPQASGKSVVAKLLYLFRDFLSTTIIESIRRNGTKRELTRRMIFHFEQIFPRYAWAGQEFSITYRYNDTQISIHRQGRSSGKGVVMEYSQDLADFHKKVKYLYKSRVEEYKGEDRPTVQYYLMLETILRESIAKESFADAFQSAVFIPASRSFFANLQKNVFSFLANNISIDPLIKEFGSVYEQSKMLYDQFITRDTGSTYTHVKNEILKEVEKVLDGQYTYEDDQDWITSGKRKINLANASSGQQESLPMFIVLLSWLVRHRQSARVVIEEPEAHLFPVSQRILVGILSRFYDLKIHSFVMTTHSPYIITGINNLVMASNIVARKGDNIASQVRKIIDNDAMIAFEDLSAYTIKDGRLESILNRELRLIGSSIIDSVSDEFDCVYDKLMELQLN